MDRSFESADTVGGDDDAARPTVLRLLDQLGDRARMDNNDARLDDSSIVRAATKRWSSGR